MPQQGLQRITAPYGDIYTPPTSAVDNTLNYIYADQKQEQAKQDAALKDLDNMYAKSVIGIRDADLPDLTQKYLTYKTIAQNNLKNKATTPQDNIKELQAQQDVYDLITRSKNQKELEKFHLGKIAADKLGTNYETTAANDLSKISTTPVSKMGENPFDVLLFKGNQADLQPALLKAAGTKKLMSFDTGKVDDATGQKEVQPVEMYNSPTQFRDLFAASLPGSKAPKVAVAMLEQAKANGDYDRVNNAYSAALPKLSKYYGLDAVKLPDDSQLNELSQAANYFSKKHALENTIEQGTKFVQNPSAVLANKQAFTLGRDATRYANQWAMMGERFKHAEKMANELPDYDNNLLAAAKNLEATKQVDANARGESLYKIPPNIKLGDVDKVYKDENTGNVRFVTYQKDPTTGVVAMQKGDDGIDRPIIAKEVPMTYDNFILTIGGSPKLAKVLGGSKGVSKSVASTINSGVGQPGGVPKERVTTIKQTPTKTVKTTVTESVKNKWAKFAK